jgi:CBS domain containing-hemolysin-like protein
MDIILILGSFALVLFTLIFVLRIPIIIAKRRGLKESDINVIALLSWISLLVGITWIIALIISLVYQPPQYSIKKQSSLDDLDELSKLFELKEEGLLSQEEFEKAKKRLL